jgi:repressor LexA
MRPFNQTYLDDILKFVNKYYQENRKAPTIIQVSKGVGVPRSTTHRYLQELSKRGMLEYDRGILSAPQSAKMKTAYISAPLVGSIQCGSPEEEEELVEEYVSLPVSLFGKGEFYILRAKGDSMVDAGINEGDLLIIDRSLNPHDGNIAVCFIDGDFTVKRLSVRADGIYLTPANASFPELKVSEDSNFQVWGIVSHIIKRL